MRKFRWLIPLILLALACRLIVPVQEPPYIVRTHPDGPLYVGDQVSFEIIAEEQKTSSEQFVVVTLDGEELGREPFDGFGIEGRSQATLWWIWNTRRLEPGAYTLDFRIIPNGPSWQETIELADSSEVPPPEPDAAWASVTTDCCILHYITGTEAERDLSALITATEAQAESVATSMQVGFEAPVNITFMPRVLGHGGFATDSIYVSYLDNNFTGQDNTFQIIKHEMVHILDGELGGDYRPTLLVEGLAVYVGGGHYKPEPVPARAAALLELDDYIPITQLANDFYHQQHEIGYLEAGALIAFMVDSYGWDGFDNFYRETEHADNDSEAIDASLRKHFNITFTQLEENFRAYLDDQLVTEPIREDLRLTIIQFDTIRRYQAAFDPSGYFLTAWLPDGLEMRERGIVADFLRRPRLLPNQVIESMLVRVDAKLQTGQYAQAENLLEIINSILDLYEK